MIDYRVDAADQLQIRTHLEECDQMFAPPLSDRVDLASYAGKIYEKAIRFEAWSDGLLVGLLAAYLADPERVGFITNVSVAPRLAGRGIGGELTDRYLSHCAQTGVDRVSLEVSATNGSAIRLYERAGFSVSRTHGSSIYMEWKNEEAHDRPRLQH